MICASPSVSLFLFAAHARATGHPARLKALAKRRPNVGQQNGPTRSMTTADIGDSHGVTSLGRRQAHAITFVAGAVASVSR
jgi:hypothetical protein